MNKNKLSFYCTFLIWIISLHPTLSHAQATREQVEQVMLSTSIPNWKDLTQKSQKIIESPPNSSWKNLWADLDNTEKSSPKNALEKASNANNAKDMFGNITWLQNKILTKNADGRYSYVYAYDLHTINLSPKEAAIFLYHARLALTIDGARCVDRASADNIKIAYENQPSLKPLIDMVNKLPLRQQSIAKLEAISLEETRGERAPIELMCNQGARAMFRAIEEGKLPQKVEANSVDKGLINGIGNTYNVDVTEIKGELIPTVEWQKARREILDKGLADAIKSL